MKKLFVAIAAAALLGAAAFAEDVTGGVDAVTGAASAIGEVANVSETLQGVWFDKKYNCNWQFQVNSGSDIFCVLKDADSGAVIYSFNKKNVKNFRAEAKTNAFTISWECEAKNRIYKFSKAIASDTDLELDIFNNVYQERHSAKITYVAGQASVN
ncbi:MAG: hypothetical protein VZQ47_04095 [Treponema sp.]|nr:hypothetical protein [Treponema sp.]MEE3434722.1 hypothetical protein [Treponema sp.]